MKSVFVAVLLLLFGFQAVTAGEGAGTITVEVGKLRNDQGLVVAALFSSADGFPGKLDQAVQLVKAPILKGTSRLEFKDVPYGTYAIAVFHDENGNGIIDSNFLHMPREGVGASNNPKPRFGPPKFAAAAFVLQEPQLKQTINVTYL